MSAKKATSAIQAAKLALYDSLLATEPGIERKGATIPYTSANGKMFTYLSSRGELRLRLPSEEREAFMTKYRTKPVVQHGVLMKDWVAVPAALFARIAELKPYLKKSRAYAVQLGARSGTRRATAGSSGAIAATRGRRGRPPAARAPARRSTSSR